ncbi:MAG: hypothetical protein ABIV25_08790 [Paracoccaceae bacterium]
MREIKGLGGLKAEGIPKGFSPLSRAPARLCAIHAIELHLSAFLRQEGVSPIEIRRTHHSLAKMSEYSAIGLLKLQTKTSAYLVSMTGNREYLISRYGPELVATHSELNRLTMTLVEVMTKVKTYLSGIPYTPSPMPGIAEH